MGQKWNAAKHLALVVLPQKRGLKRVTHPIDKSGLGSLNARLRSARKQLWLLARVSLFPRTQHIIGEALLGPLGTRSCAHNHSRMCV